MDICVHTEQWNGETQRTQHISHLCHQQSCCFSSSATYYLSIHNSCWKPHKLNRHSERSLQVNLGFLLFTCHLHFFPLHHSWNTDNRLTQVPHQCTRSAAQSLSWLSDPPGSITDHRPLSSFCLSLRIAPNVFPSLFPPFFHSAIFLTSRHGLSLN